MPLANVSPELIATFYYHNDRKELKVIFLTCEYYYVLYE